jgi:hypothetical protein
VGGRQTCELKRQEIALRLLSFVQVVEVERWELMSSIPVTREVLT